MKKKLKQHDILIDVFESGLTLLLGTKEDAYAFLSKSIKEEVNPVKESVTGHTWTIDSYNPVVWLPRYPRTPLEFATLAHEAVHVVMSVFETKGIPIREENDEVFAYTVGYIVKKVLEIKK